jgi:predicted dehydrogenase
LEKPGAPTVTELEQMKNEAEAAGVEVLMGYNKNVCKYVRKTREYADTIPDSHVTFVSNNAYENTPESLGECFERNAEGMLKNMAIHELALLVSFYDVSIDNIAEVVADKEFSSIQTLKGPSGKDFTDFDKIKFTIKTKNGKEVSVSADRCGGTDSFATVTDARTESTVVPVGPYVPFRGIRHTARIAVRHTHGTGSGFREIFEEALSIWEWPL